MLFPLSRVATWSRWLWLEVFGCEEKPGRGWMTGTAGQAGCPRLTSDVSVAVEGKLTHVPPGNWEMQEWNPEGK